MSNPTTVYKDPLDGALAEILSAKSALNMEPDPIPEAERIENALPFLSRTDRWASHAMEHLTCAFELVQKAQKSQKIRSIPPANASTGKGMQFRPDTVRYYVDTFMDALKVTRIPNARFSLYELVEMGVAGVTLQSVIDEWVNDLPVSFSAREVASFVGQVNLEIANTMASAPKEAS